MPRDSRLTLVSKITNAISNYGPMILSEISNAVRANPETVKSCVRSMVRHGCLFLRPECRPTGSGPAKVYDVPKVQPWQASEEIEVTESPVIQALDRWADCVFKRNLESLSEADRALFWMIESSIKNMPVHQAIALMHVHGCSVWIFRKMDMAEVYQEALAVISRRVEPLLERGHG